MDSPNKEFTELDWIKLNKEVHAGTQIETTQEKFIRKITENPFVPIGCLATFAALSYGLWSFRKGRRQMSQYMMRARIVAQGFTIVALIAGCLATFAALSYGLWSFRKGRRQMSQYMMRTRIAAQGFTIVALIAGIALSARNTVPKN